MNIELTYNLCPTRFKEMEILKFKCQHFLSFIDARSQFSHKVDPKSYAKVMSARKTDLQELQKILEASSNAILKIIVDYNSQQSEKVLESIARLSSLLMNCLAKLNDESLERRKRLNHGEAPLPVSSVLQILACPVNSLVFVFFTALFILI